MKKKTVPFYLLLQDSLLCQLLALLVFFLLKLVVVNLSVFNPFQAALKDFDYTDIYYSQKFHKPKPNTDLVIVNIGSSNRYEIANLLTNIYSSDPKAVGLDILFQEPKNAFADSVLSEAINHPLLVKGYYFNSENKRLSIHPSLTQTNIQTAGYLNLDYPGKTNRVIRKCQPIRQIGDSLFYSFPLQLADKVEGVNKERRLFQSVHRIHYQGSKENFITLQANEVTDSMPGLTDKIVLVGFLSNNINNVEDKHFTPLNPVYAGKSLPDMNGLIIHANVLNMYLQSSFIYSLPGWLTWLLALIINTLTCMFFLKANRKGWVSYQLLITIIQFIYTVFILYMGILLIDHNIHIQTVFFILSFVLSIQMIIYYKFIAEKIYKKWNIKNSFYS